MSHKATMSHDQSSKCCTGQLLATTSDLRQYLQHTDSTASRPIVAYSDSCALRQQQQYLLGRVFVFSLIHLSMRAEQLSMSPVRTAYH